MENMNYKYRDQIKKIFPVPDAVFNQLINHISLKEVPACTILLSAGDIATKLLIVLKGCLRQYYIKNNGADITAQFFIEGQMVASFESAFMKKPSRSFIETIEDSMIGGLDIEVMEKMKKTTSHSPEYFNHFLKSRLVYYMNQHASFILDTPEERYLKLLQESPDLVERLPKQYIASYLGITPVSLSRIRTRIKK